MPSTAFSYVAAGALAVALAAGCAKSSDQSSQSTTTATTAQTATVTGDGAHGKQIFAANCASCHGANGVEGGIGPSLKGEKARKNFAATVAWVHDPKPPMPKLWPSPLGDKDVQDVAAYVQSL